MAKILRKFFKKFVINLANTFGYIEGDVIIINSILFNSKFYGLILVNRKT